MCSVFPVNPNFGLFVVYSLDHIPCLFAAVVYMCTCVAHTYTSLSTSCIMFTDPQLMMDHLMSVYALWVGMMMPKSIVTGRMLFFQQQGEGGTYC